jgi:hypothetical protein
MTTFLFWNLNRRPLLPLIRALFVEHRVDVLVLAESQLSTVALLDDLGAAASSPLSLPFNLSDELQLLVRYPAESFRPIRDEPGLMLQWCRPPGSLDILLVLAHLRSKRYLREADQAQLAMRCARYIEDAEGRIGHHRTIVLGDLNMNPFEPGMVGSEGFHAVPTRALASRSTRIVHGLPRRFFYNPMWGFFGDRTPGPPGTYYFNSSSPTALFWHMFDQVLIRPALLEQANDYTVHIRRDVALIRQRTTKSPHRL